MKKCIERMFFVLTFIVVILISSSVFADELYQVSGVSMESTLHNGDVVKVISTSFNDGDIVIADTGDKLVIKRVVGDMLIGDNREVTAVFRINEVKVLGKAQKVRWIKDKNKDKLEKVWAEEWTAVGTYTQPAHSDKGIANGNYNLRARYKQYGEFLGGVAIWGEIINYVPDFEQYDYRLSFYKPDGTTLIGSTNIIPSNGSDSYSSTTIYIDRYELNVMKIERKLRTNPPKYGVGSWTAVGTYTQPAYSDKGIANGNYNLRARYKQYGEFLGGVAIWGEIINYVPDFEQYDYRLSFYKPDGTTLIGSTNIIPSNGSDSYSSTTIYIDRYELNVMKIERRLRKSVPTIVLNNSSTNQTINASGTVSISGTASDLDGDNITISATINEKIKTQTVASGGTFTLSWTGSELAEGSYSNIVFTANDGNGGTASATYTGTITVDKTPPTGSDTGNPTSWQSTDATLTVTGSDAESGMKRIKKPDGTWVNGSSASYTVGANGTYTFVLEDNAGNQANYDVVVTKINKTPPTEPTINITSPIGYVTGTWTNQKVTFTITSGTDTGGSGIAKSQYSINGGAWTDYGSPVTITTEGVKTVKARTLDNAGNVSSEDVVTIKIDKAAPTAAGITVNSGHELANSNPLVVALNGVSDNYTARADIKVYLNHVNITPDPADPDWENYKANCNYSYFGADGTITIYAWFKDGAGNVSAAYSDNITIDTTPVNGTIEIAGGKPRTINEKVTLTFTKEAADVNKILISNSAIRSIDASTAAGAGDGTNIGDGVYVYSYADTINGWTLNSSTEGTKTVYAKYLDWAGNIGNMMSDDIEYGKNRFITCDEYGRVAPGDKIFTKGKVTVDNLDASGNYVYGGVDIGIFKKPVKGSPAAGQTDWPRVGNFVKRITTDQKTITIENFGDLSNYNPSGVYTIGYRPIYYSVNDTGTPLIEGKWCRVTNSYFTLIPSIRNIGHTQLITYYYENNKKIAETSEPDNPTHADDGTPITGDELGAYKKYNTFINGDILTYVVGFDVTNLREVNKIKVNLKFNTGNVEGVTLQARSAKIDGVSIGIAGGSNNYSVTMTGLTVGRHYLTYTCNLNIGKFDNTAPRKNITNTAEAVTIDASNVETIQGSANVVTSIYADNIIYR